MRTMGRTFFAVAVGLLLVAGIPYPAITPVQADPGCGHRCGPHEGHGPDCPQYRGCPGCGCECGYPKGAGQPVPPCMQDNTAVPPCGMHRMMHGSPCPPAMRERMGAHLAETKEKVLKLREIEAKMAERIKDGESFRALSLEHAKLLTDIQASHVEHMEGMAGGRK